MKLRHRAVARSLALLLAASSSILPVARADQPIAPSTAPTAVAAPVAGAAYTNPLGVQMADPDVLLHDGTYYLYATSWTNLGYRVWTSRDLVNWQAHEELALTRDHNSWGHENFWAPDALEHNGKFYLFYNCVGPVGDGRTSHRICVAVSDSPLGPFQEVRAPMADFKQAVIDAFAFVDSDGKPYLYYALDHSENLQPNGRRQSQIWVVPLSADLLSTAGRPTQCITATQRWEGLPDIQDTWNEAPFVFKHTDTYVLMYSARVFSDPLYAIGYATSKSPLGPWTKAAENPILKKTSRVSGPGHNSVVPSPDGKDLFVVYHSHIYREGGDERELNIDRMTVTDEPDGSVKLHIAGPTRTPQPMPSGTTTTQQPNEQQQWPRRRRALSRQ
jgi:beta-xylosidase